MVPRHSRRFLESFLLLIGFLQASEAQEGEAPDFDLKILAPTRVVGEAGTEASLEASVVLVTSPTRTSRPIGAQGWALSIRTDPPEHLRSATLAGTAGDSPPAGFFADGFRLVEMTKGEDNVGVICAVALSLTQPAQLPRSGSVVILRLQVAGTIPVAAESPQVVWVEFHEGLRGSGQPTGNSVIFAGQKRKDDGGPSDLDLDREEPARVLLCVPDQFIRGDCLPDGRRDITDAINILNYLFLGSLEPTCLDACDSNDDEILNITDAIHLLGFLFLGTAPPPAPAGECGLDPAGSDLDCCATICPSA